jgi:hypothetical protein
MAGATRKYGIAFFDFGDPLNSRINAQLEVDRFVLIDEQLFGLYSIFGDGVISGWTHQARERLGRGRIPRCCDYQVSRLRDGLSG